MAMRISWDEQEALLLFDTYEKIQKSPDKKAALTTALSINLRRRATDRGLSIDDVFRNRTGISMRLSEIEKILYPQNSGLTNTSELFRTTAELYVNHRKTFHKKLLELEEYRVKILADLVGFDLLESIVLLDAYLHIGAPGETRAHTSRLVSAKLRNLAINRGCVITEAYRSDGGIAGRLRKMETAFQDMSSGVAEAPQIFNEAVTLYYNNRSEYKRLLRYANLLIGRIVLPEDAAKIEKAKQQAKDAAPVQRTKYIKTKKDRKLKEDHPKEFVAVYKALEHRCYTDLDGATATDIFLDLKKKHQRKVIIEILAGASWARELRTGKYVHVLGASIMAMQESNENKFFAWLKTKATSAQCKEMKQATGIVSLMLMQKKITKKPLFLMDNADEVCAVINKVSSCFASSKTRKIAIQIVNLYATYLKECASVSNIAKTIQTEQGSVKESCDDGSCSLHVGDDVYVGETPAIAFAHFCEKMAVSYPLKIRSLVGIRIRGTIDIPLKRSNDGACTKMANVNAYIDNRMLSQNAEEYTRWICNMCGVEPSIISVSIDQTVSDKCESLQPRLITVPEQVNIPAVNGATPNTTQTSVATSERNKIELTDTIDPNSAGKKENPLLGKMEQIVLRADMDGMSYDDLKDTMQITMVLTKQLVAQSAKIVDIKGVLIHEAAFIDWEDGADILEDIIEKLMLKNNGYISSAQLFEYARIEMNMFLNDNDMREERAVYDMAQHLFEKTHYHDKSYTFRWKMHISRPDAAIGSNLDVFKKYAADQGGVFSFNGLIEYLEKIGINIGNLRNQMKMWTEPIFFSYDIDVVATSEALHIDEGWIQSIKKSLDVLFDDAGDHLILRNIPSIWFDRLPTISGNRPWTPLLLQSVLRFYSAKLGARTIQALEGQSLETLHTMLVSNDSPIQCFGDVVISCLLEQNVERRQFDAEELRMLLVDAGIIHGNELIWNMPKALKSDERFAWDASGNQVTVKI